MQKFIAIVLLALMSLFFHGRQLSYMQCVLVNEFRQGIPLCDCQQITAIQAHDADTNKDHAQHQHFSLAEWYIQQPQTPLKITVHSPLVNHYTVYTKGLYNNFTAAILKPPRFIMFTV